MEFLENLKAHVFWIMVFLATRLQRQPTLLSSTPSTSGNHFETDRQPEPSPSANDESTQEQSQAQQQLPTTAISQASSDQKLVSMLAAQQQHLQWKNPVLTFCFSYALAIALQHAQTNHQGKHEPTSSSLVLFSFLVLLTFNLNFVAFFISPSCTKTSELLDKIALIAAGAAFCYATAIPFQFKLKCTVLAVFLLSFLLITIFKYLKPPKPAS